MYSELKYIKTETFPNVFEMSISGKKHGDLFVCPVNKQNSDYIAIMKLVDSGELTVTSHGGKYFCYEDLSEKDES